MKKTQVVIKMIFTCGLVLILIGMVLLREDDIVTILNTRFFTRNTEVSLGEKNEYYRDYDFQFVQNTDLFSPMNYQDIINIYYTVLNSGQNSFTFYCPSEYSECLDDIQRLANDQESLSDINNFVHPYNGFSHIETEFDSLGRVTITIIKSYTADEIQMINQKIEELYPQLVSPNRGLEDNVRSIHDYIITHAKYDSARSDHGDMTYKSDIAYGPLFEGYAICGGYTDLMELFLEKMGVKCFKVSSDDHVWNAIQMGNNWYHIDLTWDDPVVSDGQDYLEHNYFLINSSRLLQLEAFQHKFNPDHYRELKEAN